MPLLELWESNPQAISQFTIEQVVSIAGDGTLLDGSLCSTELRSYLSVVPSETIFHHIDRCLTHPFPKSGAVLQDLINELGRRLDYQVDNGLYQGRVNAIGFDGIWKAPDGYALVVEVKTTDAYRINLDTIARYRFELIKQGRINEQSAALIVVGRQDTGDIEAQIRGSRHAWDIRLISADALISLVRLKERAEEDETITKIRGLLIPFEYTRLDNIIDVMFTAARDVEAAAETGTEGHGQVVEDPRGHGVGARPRAVRDGIQTLPERIATAMGTREGKRLIAHKRSLYWSVDKKVRVVWAISKRYDRGYYWYPYHPAWDEFLNSGEKAYLVLGCMDREVAYALPYKLIHSQLAYLNSTFRANQKMYWHIILQIEADERLSLVLPRKSERLSLTDYELPLG